MTTAQLALHLKRRPHISSRLPQIITNVRKLPNPEQCFKTLHLVYISMCKVYQHHPIWWSPITQILLGPDKSPALTDWPLPLNKHCGPRPRPLWLEAASYLLSPSIRGWPANTLRQTVWQRLDLCPNNSKGKYSKWFIKLSSRKLKSLEIMSVTALAGCCRDRGAVTFRHVLFPILAHGSNR